MIFCVQSKTAAYVRTSSFDSTDYKELQFMPYSHKTLKGQGPGTIFCVKLFTLKWHRYHYVKPIPMYWKGTHEVQKDWSPCVPVQVHLRVKTSSKFNVSPGASRGPVKALCQ